MHYIIFVLIVIMTVRTVSLGIVSIKDGNVSGGVAVLVLSLLSLISGSAVLY